jgi:hypothetical protein
MVKAHWTLRHLNLADSEPGMVDIDRKLVASARHQMSLLQTAV